uniref:NADH dehydrogenase subunit 6 n=1 Tax=Chyliza chikuni TaxID=2963720 RepID=UPI002114D01D|nr:NADH dehydrogenase subunit 6 [Chyliza chikuni]UTM10334.1 NADH dehydrogenase subunit 6 [Chyliza chikuni]
MMQLILISMIFILNLIFMQMKHPLAMGIMLLIQTTSICLITGLFAKTFWFSYILFLIFLGGMLVLFIYVTSLASNEMFSFSIQLIMISIFLFNMSLMLIYIMDKSLMMNLYNMEMMPMNNMNNLMPENILSLYKFYNFPINLITILLMNYLLITLIAVVKITNLFYGPLRQMN